MTSQKIISIVNRKGGVGKTTLAMGIADAFVSEHRAHVCVLDLDPQSSASQALLPADEYENRVRNDRNLHGLLLARLSGEDPDVHEYRRDMLHFIKGREDVDLRLYPNSQRLWDLEERELRFDGGARLSNAIKRILRQEVEDGRIVIVDCPPGQSVSALAAIQGSDMVLCPITPDRLAMWGKDVLTEYLKDYAPKVRRRFVVTRATYRDKEARSALDRLVKDPEMLQVISGDRSRTFPDITRLSEQQVVRTRIGLTREKPLRHIYGSLCSRELTLIVNAIRRELEPRG
jgi:cellulose biosynthesis protein BcsQ